LLAIVSVNWCRNARELFEKMMAKNLMAWTAMINGNAQTGRPRAALAFFTDLEAAGIEPENKTAN
jgi:pentatricopeptide repeat protein